MHVVTHELMSVMHGVMHMRNCKRFASPASPIVDLFVRNCAIFATDVFACQLSALLLKTLVEKMQCWGNSPPISSDLVESVELYTTL